ncbi:MAG: DUF1217 domain-containing protein [Paracoccaceae bacterium]
MLQPVVIGTGLVGWQFMQNTYDRQLESFTQNPELKRDIDHFEEKIGRVFTAEALVSDRQLLGVALGAFGLEDDLDNRYFIQKMLEEGTTADDALANRFTDTRYREFSEAFGFGPSEIPQTFKAGFAAEIVEKYKANSFEIATGFQDENMRVALYAQRTLSDVVSEEGSNAQKWFSIMGQPALRELFQTAFNLPSQFGQVDIDQQLGVFEERAEREFGTSDPSIFSDPEAVEDLVRTYLARAQVAEISAGQSSGSIALQLLQF